MKLLATFFLGTAVLACATAAQSQPELQQPPVVMLVGVYHFDNPGLDVVNVVSDDVSTPRRQGEIVNLTRQFARFRPTTIAIEETGSLPLLESATFADRAAGRRANAKSERDQLGFRLADLTGARIAAVDVDMPLPFGPLMETAAEAAPRLVAQAMASVQAQATATSQALASGTVADALIYLNTPETLRANDDLYYLTLPVSADGGETLPGVAVASAWYERNLRICTRILSLAEAGQRLIVFYGSGHIPQLSQCLSKAGVRLEDPLPYLAAAR